MSEGEYQEMMGVVDNAGSWPEGVTMYVEWNFKQIEQVLSACEDNTERLSEWERDQFIPSLRDQFDRYGRITEKQQEILDRIYQKVL